jgi:hypothetical protein
MKFDPKFKPAPLRRILGGSWSIAGGYFDYRHKRHKYTASIIGLNLSFRLYMSAL